MSKETDKQNVLEWAQWAVSTDYPCKEIQRKLVDSGFWTKSQANALVKKEYKAWTKVMAEAEARENLLLDICERRV